MLTPHSLMLLITNSENKVLTVQLDMEDGKDKVYLKDLQWELQNCEDMHNLDMDVEDDSAKRKILAVFINVTSY